MSCCGSDKAGTRTRRGVYLVLATIGAALLVVYFQERLLAIVPFLALLVGPILHEVMRYRMPKVAPRAASALAPGNSALPQS